MSGRIGIDFGTSNSVVAAWNEQSQSARPLGLPELGLDKRIGSDVMNVIPSLVHYADDGRTWYGSQVITRNLYDDQLRTFRWMKRFVSQRAVSIPRHLPGDRSVTPLDAATDFLSYLLQETLAEIGVVDDEVAFAVPVESFEHYEKWVREVAEEAGILRFRLIDEASAAALGYSANIQPGDVYLVFDFGGGTLDVSIVRIAEEDVAGGRRCRVLGKQGLDVGGSTIDSWLYEEVLRRTGRTSSDEDVRRLSAELLVRCEAAKELLSLETTVDISAQDPASGRVIATDVTRADFEDLLDQHDLLTRIDRIVSSSIGKSREKGFDEDAIKNVLLVGGSSAIPAVQKHLVRRFGRDRVLLSQPLVAVAVGAAAFVAGVDFFDHIQHDYAIQHVNPVTGTYEYRTLVEAGTAYPTDAPVAQVTVKAAWDGQEELGLRIFELANSSARDNSQAVELVFDHSGAARMIEISTDELYQRSHFWMNEQAPTFLVADPPGRKGEERFRVEFHVDESKRLLVTARDVKTNRWVFDRTPVVKLT